MRGVVLIAFGILYLMKPNIFQSGIWMKISTTASNKTPEEYGKYMKKIAIALIVIGLILLAYDNQQIFKSTPDDDGVTPQLSVNFNILTNRYPLCV